MNLNRTIIDSINWLTEKVGYHVAISKKNGFPSDMSADDVALFNSVRNYTMTTIERISALRVSVEYIVQHNIPGEIVECGVWRGGSMMTVAKTLQEIGDTSRRMRLYDTFKGMGPPAPEDGADVVEQWKQQTAQDHNKWCFAPLEDVRANLASTGYPSENILYIQGLVEETLQDSLPDQIAILRLDTDFYSSTLAELNQLYPRLSPGGVLIIDDYGHFAGARKAVDEYFSKTSKLPLLCRTDYTARICIKPQEKTK